MFEHRLFPCLLIICAGPLWSSSFSPTPIATSEGVHPPGLLAWQIAVTVPIIFVIAPLGRVRLFAWRHLCPCAFMAIVGITLTSATACGLFFHSFRVAGPVFANQCSCINTLAGVFRGMLLPAGSPALRVRASVAVMLLGLAMVNPDENRQNSGIGDAETAKSTLC